jgi:outer membrane protein
MSRTTLLWATALLLATPAFAQPTASPARGRNGNGNSDDTTLRTRLTTLVARPAGLVADDVAARAVQSSFDLRQKKEELLAAAASVDQALVGYFPRLALLARYARLSSITNENLGNVVLAAQPGAAPAQAETVAVPLVFPALLNQTTLQASLTVPLLDYVLRTPAVHDAAKHQREAARWSAGAARLQIATDARSAYYQWARARLQTVVAEQALLQARGHLTDARHAFDVGNANKADVLRVEAQVASSELFLERAKDLEAVWAEQLHTAMHDGQAPNYEIGEDLRVDLPPLTLEGLDQLVNEAWRGRREVRVLAESRGAQTAQTRATRAGWLPHVDAFGDLLSGDPNPRYFPQIDHFRSTWDVGAQLTWSPNEAAAAEFGARAQRAKERSIEAQEGQLHDRLRIEVTQAVASLHESDFAVQSTARGLDAAEESYRVRRDLYANGRATSIELTDAETDLTQARLNAIGARIDQRVARVRLVHALGRDAGDDQTKVQD